MTHENGKTQSIRQRSRMRDLLIKPGVVESEIINAKREKFLALLSSRYGYTNEKAVDELERLLKQFHRINKSLGFHRTRMNMKHPHTD